MSTVIISDKSASLIIYEKFLNLTSNSIISLLYIYYNYIVLVSSIFLENFNDIYLYLIFLKILIFFCNLYIC